MRYVPWFLLALLCSCAAQYDIRIKNQPNLCPHEGYDFILCRGFTYFINGDKQTIPRGFTTDLASIPKILWPVYAPNRANTIAAAVIHDYLYRCPNKMTRYEADSVLYNALMYGGVTKRRAFLYWLAVRAFGRSHFNDGIYCDVGVG